MPSRVRIGFVRRVHGLQGEIEVQTFDPASQTLRKGSTIWIVENDEDTAPARRVLAVRTGKEGVVLRVEGVEDRGTAESLKGRQVDVERDALPKTKPNEFYLIDLLGYAVETVRGESVGELTDLQDGGGHRLLVVVAPSGRRVLVPAVADMIPRVDHERKTVVIDPPEGLLDL